MNQIKCISKVKQEQGCYVLSYNQTHNKIVGGRGKDIIIWQQNQLKLKEISVLKSHIDFVFAIAIYQSGDMIVSWKKFNKLVTKGSIHRIYYTNNDELLVQQENPSILIVYQKDQNNQYQPVQDIILNEPDNNEILFPIFQIKNTIYLKNDKFVYVISRLVIGKFYIQQILQKRRLSGCRDCSGEGIILWNAINKSIETYK